MKTLSFLRFINRFGFVLSFLGFASAIYTGKGWYFQLSCMSMGAGLSLLIFSGTLIDMHTRRELELQKNSLLAHMEILLNKSNFTFGAWALGWINLCIGMAIRSFWVSNEMHPESTTTWLIASSIVFGSVLIFISITSLSFNRK